jgi:hypothetical protein
MKRLLFLTVFLAAVVALPSLAQAATYQLDVSSTNNRSNATVLNGQKYAVGTQIYVFSSPNTSGITKVAFSLDGALKHTELKAPYDFNASNDTNGTAYPYSVPSGSHTISAKIYFSSGTSSTVSGSFVGVSSTPPPPPPPPPTPSGCTPSTTQTLTGSQSRQIVNNTYHVQANEWDSSAPFAVANDGCPDFSVTQSQIAQSGGAPGAYPSLYKGCHWGNCTSNSGLPLQAGTIQQGGKVTTSANTTTITTGAWDDSYDIWWNPASNATNNSSGLEMMIWLTKRGSVQPAGSVVASNVNIGGRTYNVWKGGSSPGGTVSYVLTSPATSVTQLDLGPLAADAVARGYMTAAWSLLDVEFGFEPWQGGAGLKVNSFNVCTPTGC